MGVFLLALGVFTPIIKLPLVGSMNYFRNGQGDGVLVLLLALGSIPFVITKRYKFLWISGLLSLAMIAVTFGRLAWGISQLNNAITSELSGGMFDGLFDVLVESIQLEWG